MKIITIATLATTALALPAVQQLEPRGFVAPLELHTQSCTAIDDGIYAEYQVRIGEPFDASICDPVGRSFKAKLLGFTGYHCKDDGWGGFLIRFTEFINMGGDIDKILEYHFPPVNGFNCPDH